MFCPRPGRCIREIATTAWFATGHLSRDEIFAVVDAAIDAGVKQIIVTHPDFPTQNLSLEDQQALAAKGAYLERCFTTAYTGKVQWETMFERIRATGVAANVLSSDLGQPSNPPVEDGLALMADRLLAAGFTEDEVHIMAVRNTVELANRGLSRWGPSRGAFWSSGPTRRTSCGGPPGASGRRHVPGRKATVVALSYGERGEAGTFGRSPVRPWKTCKRIRHEQAVKAAEAIGAEFRCLDLGDYPAGGGSGRPGAAGGD